MIDRECQTPVVTAATAMLRVSGQIPIPVFSRESDGFAKERTVDEYVGRCKRNGRRLELWRYSTQACFHRTSH